MSGHAPTMTETTRVRQHVMDMIRDTREPHAQPVLSERKLSQATGTSRTTVRRALRELIDAGILMPQRGRGTFVNRKALNGHERKRIQTGTIGVLFYGKYVCQPSGAYGWSVLKGINEALGEQGWHLTHLTPAAPGLLAAEQIVARKLDGLIWVSPSVDHRTTIEQLTALGLPVVVINRNADAGTPHHVTVDHHAEGQLAAEHLISSGHHRILFVGTDSERPHLAYRYEGFAAGHMKHRLAHDSSLVLDVFPATQTVKHMANLLDRTRDFSAIFVADTLYLPAVLTCLRQCTLRVPEDLSIVAHAPELSYISDGIQLDSIHSPLEKLGQTAANRIIKLLQCGGSAVIREQLQPRLVRGNSTRPWASFPLLPKRHADASHLKGIGS